MTPTQLVNAINAKLHRESAQRAGQITHAKRIIAIGRCAEGGSFRVVSDPAWIRWQDEGAPKCSAMWAGSYDVLPEDQRDSYVGM